MQGSSCSNSMPSREISLSRNESLSARILLDGRDVSVDIHITCLHLPPGMIPFITKNILSHASLTYVLLDLFYHHRQRLCIIDIASVGVDSLSAAISSLCLFSLVAVARRLDIISYLDTVALEYDRSCIRICR